MEQFISLMQKYFSEEKSESLLFMVMGIFSIALGGYALFKGGQLLKGMAYPLIAVGLIQLVVGSSVYFRTDKQVTTLTTQVKSQPAAFKTDEGKRMEVVIYWFKVYKSLEITLALTGLLLITANALWGLGSLWAGVGAGLLLQSTVMLVLDLFAEDRAAWYYEAIQKL